jgi:excisionase family DNA binding protein
MTNECELDELDQIGFSVAEAAKKAGVGRSTIYEELASGRLRARKLGRRTIILKSDHQEWLASLPTLKPSGTPEAA